MPRMMKADIFAEPNCIVLDDNPVPDVNPRDTLIRISTTMIRRTDVRIFKGSYRTAATLRLTLL